MAYTIPNKTVFTKPVTSLNDAPTPSPTMDAAQLKAWLQKNADELKVTQDALIDFLNQVFTGTVTDATTAAWQAYNGLNAYKDYNDSLIGILSTLNTTDKSSLVNAIKEVKTEVDTKANQSALNTTNANVELKANITDVNTQVAAVASGSPAAVFATLATLQADATANTIDGKKRTYIVTADGKWYYWNGSAWAAGGIYQATGISTNSIKQEQTNFIVLGKNIVLDSDKRPGYYVNGATGEIAANSNWEAIDLKAVTSGATYTITLFDGNGVAANSAQQQVWAAFYDSSKAYAGKGFEASLTPVNYGGYTSWSNANGKVTFTVPANASYVAFSYASNVSYKFPQLEAGPTGTAYEKGCFKLINSKYLESIADNSITLNMLAPDVTNVINTNKVKLQLPDTFDMVMGDTFELFYNGVILANDPTRYNIRVTTSYGNNYERKYMFTPTAPGSYSVTMSLEDDNQNILDTKTFTIVVSAKPTSPVVNKNILCIGDSLTAGGTWVAEMYRRLTGTGGTPTGDALSNIQFVGTKNLNGAGYEGYGGWTFTSYLTNTATDSIIWAHMASHDKDINDQHSIYADGNGIQWSLETIEATAIKLKRVSGSGILPSSGTLTWVSGGAHHTSITYSSTSPESGNPFWNENTSQVDFANYASELGISSIDHVFILLGWNTSTDSETTCKTNAKALIDKIYAAFPTCKVTLLGLQVAPKDGVGLNRWNYYDILGYVFNLNKWYNDIAIEYVAAGKACQFVNVAAQFDSDYNMPKSTRVVNTRNATTETYYSNDVHPLTEGYYQIADIAYRHFVHII